MNLRSFLSNKSNTSQAFWIGMGRISSIAVVILSGAILSRYLDKTEYGTYRQILYVYNTLIIVFTAGLPRVFNYFLPRYDKARGKEIVFKVSKVLFLTGFAFTVFLYAGSGVIAGILKNPELERGLKIFSPVPTLLLPTLGIEGIFSTYKRTVYIAVYGTVTRLLMLACIVIPIVVYSQSYVMAIYGWIASSFLTLLLAFYFKGIPFKGISQEKSNLSFREILGYSLPLVSASIADMIYRSANQFYVSRFYGTEVFAEFSNGFIEIPFVGMITGATATVLMPIFSKIVHEKGEVSQITTLWRSALEKSAILIYPMVLFFMFYAREVVTIVFSEKYAVSATYFSIAMVLNFFNIIIFAPLILSMGESRFYARLHYGVAIATWVVEFLAVIIFDTPVAIAVSFVAVSVVKIFVSIGFVSRKLEIPFFTLFPVSRFVVIAFHSFISLFLVNLVLRRALPEMGDFYFISISGILFGSILVLTSRLFRIRYQDIYISLFRKHGAG